MFYAVLLSCISNSGALMLPRSSYVLSDVQLTLLDWMVHVPLGVLLLAAFLAGALCLYLVAVVSARRDRRAIQRLRMRVEELEHMAMSMRAPSGPLPVAPPIVPMPGMPNPLQVMQPFHD
ncbi:MAG: lipopolysaccharide assembly protein LapA domain-containing protein [Ktedonobacteraceae bacterium]|nr:lipopolysaccharide assembly protein LapA domain-containing protein [Chloroflexota bacterium]